MQHGLCAMLLTVLAMTSAHHLHAAASTSATTPQVPAAQRDLVAEYAMLWKMSEIHPLAQRHQIMAEWARDHVPMLAQRHDLQMRSAIWSASTANVAVDRSGLERRLALAKQLRLSAQAHAAQVGLADLDLAAELRALPATDARAALALVTRAIAARPQPSPELITQLAERVIAHDAMADLAQQWLGRVRVPSATNAYVFPKDGLSAEARQSGNRAARAAWHAAAASAAALREPPLLGMPFASTATVVASPLRIWPNRPDAIIYRFEMAGREAGSASTAFYQWTPFDFVPAEPPQRPCTPGGDWGLVVMLHGGGSGGIPMSEMAAQNTLGFMHDEAHGSGFVAIAPVLHSHPINAWNIPDNQALIADCIEEVRRRIRIDPRRIHLYGSSMGAGGAWRLCCQMPEAFASYATTNGYYWREGAAVPDLTGVLFTAFHGVPDTQYGRDDTARMLEQAAKKAGATMTLTWLDGVGHSPALPVSWPVFIKQWRSTVSPVAPDTGLMRTLLSGNAGKKHSKPAAPDKRSRNASP